MARFVRDVTLPDGTHLQCGSVARKTWLVRNDGSIPWPDGTVLKCSGGDFLTDPEMRLPVPNTAANEEVEISVDIKVPTTTGRHVAYFRLCTGEGSFFGQRFWSDIRAAEELPMESHIYSLAQSSREATLDRIGQTTEPQQQVQPGSTTYSGRAPIAGETASIMRTGVVDDIPQTAATEPEALAVWAKVWSKELEMLADMGFNDTPVLLQLLQKHVGVPVSLTPELNGVPPADRMQRVVASLFSVP
jgi:hypothetical protein